MYTYVNSHLIYALHYIYIMQKGDKTNNHNFLGDELGVVNIHTVSIYIIYVYIGVCVHTHAYVYNLKVFLHFIVNIMLLLHSQK